MKRMFTIGLLLVTTSLAFVSLPAQSAPQYSVRRVRSNVWVVKRSDLRPFLKSEARNRLARDVRLRRYRVRGKQKGYTLRRVTSGSLPHKLGLRSGDVLLKVNGTNLRNDRSALKALTANRNARVVRVDVKRGRRILAYYYRVR